jgi:hypothetical protein
MQNPFETESTAFSFLLLTVAAFTLVAVAGILGGVWVGVAVWAIVTACAVVIYARRKPPDERVKTAPAHVGAPDDRRILVITSEAVDGDLVDEIGRAAAGYRAEVLVVCPALTSRMQHWASDTDGASSHAGELLDTSLARLRARGLSADGRLGDEDPVQAIDDALRTFAADEIFVCTHRDDRLHWLERGVVTRSRERFGVPITHVVAGAEAEVSSSPGK